MDLHNNLIGAGIANSMDDQTSANLALIILGAMNEGALKILDENGNAVQVTMTDEDYQQAIKNLKQLNNDGVDMQNRTPRPKNDDDTKEKYE